MDRFCLTGYPLGHSVSPFIHKKLFEMSKVTAEYELCEIPPAALKEKFASLKEYRGFNVTIPHKQSIIPLLDALSYGAELCGAVNTVDVKDGVCTGYNTDCTGFLRALELADIKLGGRVLICGSGGVSSMFAAEAALAGAQVTLAVRDSGLEKAQAIRSRLESRLSQSCGIVNINDVDGSFDLMINGTPAGMYPDTEKSPLPEKAVRNCGAVFDAVYNPRETKLLSCAKNAGIKHQNGLAMLVLQAAAAQEIWTGAHFTQEQIKELILLTEREVDSL
jgi:shikimate dehydrogenase